MTRRETQTQSAELEARIAIRPSLPFYLHDSSSSLYFIPAISSLNPLETLAFLPLPSLALRLFWFISRETRDLLQVRYASVATEGYPFLRHGRSVSAAHCLSEIS
ncbi:hypothetical protein H6P81_008400 [Aristolochia fimbriata]|uniref:Uncharacterized protein n=1 Tax=Aristolochia fimbriata TaxID=158543 RepID=A0AAV7EJZ7_ARIFI|nr:hypothetical protein H6P81_008400 [Aristolochia fimbriata]